MCSLFPQSFLATRLAYVAASSSSPFHILTTGIPVFAARLHPSMPTSRGVWGRLRCVFSFFSSSSTAWPKFFSSSNLTTAWLNVMPGAHSCTLRGKLRTTFSHCSCVSNTYFTLPAAMITALSFLLNPSPTAFSNALVQMLSTSSLAPEMSSSWLVWKMKLCMPCTEAPYRNFSIALLCLLLVVVKCRCKYAKAHTGVFA